MSLSEAAGGDLAKVTCGARGVEKADSPILSHPATFSSIPAWPQTPPASSDLAQNTQSRIFHSFRTCQRGPNACARSGIVPSKVPRSKAPSIEDLLVPARGAWRLRLEEITHSRGTWGGWRRSTRRYFWCAAKGQNDVRRPRETRALPGTPLQHARDRRDCW